MAHKRLTYLDIPAPRRKATAGKAMSKLKEALTNPVLTPEQEATIRARIDHLTQWTAGNLEADEVPDNKKPQKAEKGKKGKKGKHHEVVVEESLNLEEEGPS